MFYGPENVAVSEAKPRETSIVEGPQNIVLFRGFNQ